MKKLLALLLALCMIFALAACGGEKTEQKEETETVEEAEEVETEEKEEAPAEEAPVEEAPAEEAPVEEAPAEEAFSVVGTWAAPVDLVKVMTTASPETAAMFGEDPIIMEILLTFAEDGTVQGDVNLDDAIPAIKAGMSSAMTQMIESEYGMSVEDFEAAAGMTLDELIDQQMDPEALKESFSSEDMSGTYVVDGDKVIINDKPENALTIQADGTMTATADDMGDLVFARK